MGYSVNKATILGNLGKDPETRALSTGTSVTNFTIATTEKYRNRDEQLVEATEWHNVEAWGNLSDICSKYLRKGSKAYIEGKIKTETYEKDGITRYKTKIVASDVVLLSSRDSNMDGSSYGNNNSNNSYSNYSQPAPVEREKTYTNDVTNLTSNDLDDIPF